MQLGISTWRTLLTGINSTFLGSDRDAHFHECVTDRTVMGPDSKQANSVHIFTASSAKSHSLCNSTL